MAGGSEWSYMGRWLGMYINGWGAVSGAIWVDGWGCVEMAGGGSGWSYMGRWLGLYRDGWGQ